MVGRRAEWSTHREAKFYRGVSLWTKDQPIERLHFTAVCPFGRKISPSKGKLLQRYVPLNVWSAHRKAKFYSGVSIWMSGQPIEGLNLAAVCPFE